MKLCSRCKKRVAVVFMTRLENNETINEGLCIRCAKELGIGPVNDMLAKMGISDDDLARMDDDMEQFAAMMSGGNSDEDGDEAALLPDFSDGGDDGELSRLFIKVGRLQFMVLAPIWLGFLFFGKFFVSDSFCILWRYLCTIFPVYFKSVVFFRIMGCSNHNARDTAVMSCCKG